MGSTRRHGHTAVMQAQEGVSMRNIVQQQQQQQKRLAPGGEGSRLLDRNSCTAPSHRTHKATTPPPALPPHLADCLQHRHREFVQRRLVLSNTGHHPQQQFKHRLREKHQMQQQQQSGGGLVACRWHKSNQHRVGTGTAHGTRFSSWRCRASSSTSSYGVAGA